MGKAQRDKKRAAQQQQQQPARAKPTAKTLLSPELQNEVEEAAPPPRQRHAAVAPPKKVSAAKRKRAAKLRQKADALDSRAELYKALRDNGASGEDLRVVRAAVAGARQSGTARQKATAALLKERRGLVLDEEEADALYARGGAKRARLDEDADAGAEDDAASSSSDDASSAGGDAAEAPVVDFAAQMMRQMATLQATPAPPPKPEAVAPDEPELVGKTGYVPQQQKLPDALTSTPSASLNAPLARPAWMPRVERSASSIAARLRLPACASEQEIIDAVRTNDVVVLSGATGSGKSTQVPQFLYEAGLCGPQQLKIAVTQPRRVAVVATAERVASELGAANPSSSKNSLVGYRTRYDAGGLGARTRLVFETDGVLLRELEGDLLLRNYGAVVLDEAHERSLTTDLLLGLLGRSVQLRRTEFKRALEAKEEGVLGPLKVIVMSATLDAQKLCDNQELWSPPPRALTIEARQHPVSIHFARETVLEDYAEEALKVVRRVHQDSADDGTILVFLTGKREIEAFCAELRDGPLDVAPLYAQMPLSKQRQAFAPKRDGYARKVVVATDVAETSLTIPGVIHVVDCGRAKRQVLVDGNSGAVAHRVAWIARANADQRAGRAGRTGPGHCHRLYSSAVYAETFEASEKPEILRLPVVDVALRVKALGVRDPSSFPFPDKPPSSSVVQACDALARLGALANVTPFTKAPLSDLGQALASLPVGARHAATLAYAGRIAKGMPEQKREGFASLAVACVAASSEQSPFREGEASEAQRRAFRHPLGDAHARLLALGAYAAASDKNTFCDAHGLDGGALNRMARLYDSLRRSCAKTGVFTKVAPLEDLAPGSAQTDSKLAKCLTAGGLDRVARLAEPSQVMAAARRACAQRGDVWDPRSLNAHDRDCAYELLGDGGFCYVHPASAAHARSRADLPEFVVYANVRAGMTGRRRLEDVTCIDGRWLAQLGHSFVALGGPCSTPEPTVVDGTIRSFRKASLKRQGEAWALPLVSASLGSFSAEDRAEVRARVALKAWGGDDLLEPCERTVPLGGAAPTARGVVLVRALVGAGDTKGALVEALRGGARTAFLACVRAARRADVAARVDQSAVE